MRGPGSMTTYHPDLLCPPPPCLSSAALHIAVTRSCRRGSCSSRPEIDRRSYIVLHNCDNQTKQLSAYDANQCNPRQPTSDAFKTSRGQPILVYHSLTVTVIQSAVSLPLPFSFNQYSVLLQLHQRMGSGV